MKNKKARKALSYFLFISIFSLLNVLIETGGSWSNLYPALKRQLVPAILIAIVAIELSDYLTKKQLKRAERGAGNK